MKTYKRFLLFGFATYYPGGGLDDIEEEFDSFETAMEFINKKIESNRLEEYSYLFDCETRTIVWEKK